MQVENHENMPPEVLALQREVEKAVGVDVFWQEDDNLDGSMSVQWVNREPVIRFRPSGFSHAGAAEELLHMKLDLHGYLIPQQTIHCKYEFQALTILHNVLQHAVIFPLLEKMGYPRYKGECESVKRQFSKHNPSEFDSERFSQEPGLLALFAMLYVRMKRHCTAEELSGLMGNLYRKHGYSDTRRMADLVLDEICLNETSSPEVYNSNLRRCLKILGLSDAVDLVDPCEQAEY